MPKRYNTPHRSHVVKTRLTDEEYADFTERLAPYGISQSEFLRQAIRRTTGRFVLVPVCLSINTRSTPSCSIRTSWRASFCSTVLTRMYPIFIYFSFLTQKVSFSFGIFQKQKNELWVTFFIRPLGYTLMEHDFCYYSLPLS